MDEPIIDDELDDLLPSTPLLDDETPFATMMSTFDEAAHELGVDRNAYAILRKPDREITVAIPVRLDDGRRVPAYAFIARRDHRQYAGHLTPEEAARLVRQGNGSRGPSREYLENTIGQLADMGIRDSALLRILKAVRAGSD